MLQRPFRRWLTCCLGSGLFTLGGGLALADEPRSTIQPPPWPEVPARVARHSVQNPFQVQAQNGLRLDQTIWNHHFDTTMEDAREVARKTLEADLGRPPRPDEMAKKLNVTVEEYNKMLAKLPLLSHSGMIMLDRLVRRYVECGCAIDLYLQTDREVAYQAEKPNQVAQERAEHDSKRILSIGTYLAANWPGVHAEVHVYDPNVPGMRGIEAVQAVQEMWREAHGTIPNYIQGGLSISKLAGGANVTGPPPSSVSSGSAPVSSLGGGEGGSP